MPDIQEIIQRFEAVGFTHFRIAHPTRGENCDYFCSGSYSIVISESWDVWFRNTRTGVKGEVELTSVMALLEAFERLTKEAENNGDGTHN